MVDNNSVRWGSLPYEILTHIFVFLSIKSIIICTSVSKWKSLIQNPTFISTHLHRSYNKNLLLFCLYPQIHKVSLVFHNEDDPHFTQHSSFDYPFHVPFQLYSYLVKENLSLGILRTKSFKDLRMIGNHNTFVDSYIESLVLLDKAANSAVTYQGE